MEEKERKEHNTMSNDMKYRVESRRRRRERERKKMSVGESIKVKKQKGERHGRRISIKLRV